MGSERGQGTVEWVGLVLVVSVAMLAMVAAGVRVPGAALARDLADRILCAASLADGCGDEPELIAAYGSDVGELVRRHMPTIAFERGSKAVPVDFRRCRSSACGDGSSPGLVHQSDAGEAVTAFVHVVDCRANAAAETEAEGADCSGKRAGFLYVQYWTYYADSATLRGIPVAGAEGYHHDDWEGVQLRFGPHGEVAERATSHNGYNYRRSPRNWGSDADIGPLKWTSQALGGHPEDGWGPESGLLFVSGGSHAGNALATFNLDEVGRYTPGRRVHLIPLEQIAASSSTSFAISPPWLKEVWLDPESDRTD
ncbi:MAG TPA: hypothetical protein VFL77_02800 [Solirubrobacterales bacterium]|nr:hypothetical protein [Solirubrobacterales bacterium]